MIHSRIARMAAATALTLGMVAALPGCAEKTTQQNADVPQPNPTAGTGPSTSGAAAPAGDRER